MATKIENNKDKKISKWKKNLALRTGITVIHLLHLDSNSDPKTWYLGHIAKVGYFFSPSLPNVE